MTSRGRKEFKRTNDDPRQVTPITTRIGANRYTLGKTRRKSMDDIAPVKPNPMSNLLR